MNGVMLPVVQHTDEAQMPALVRALRELIDPRAAEHSQVLQGFIALLLARGLSASACCLHEDRHVSGIHETIRA